MAMAEGASLRLGEVSIPRLYLLDITLTLIRPLGVGSRGVHARVRFGGYPVDLAHRVSFKVELDGYILEHTNISPNGGQLAFDGNTSNANINGASHQQAPNDEPSNNQWQSNISVNQVPQLSGGYHSDAPILKVHSTLTVIVTSAPSHLPTSKSATFASSESNYSTTQSVIQTA
ncbi:hypothetical protein ACEPPN_004022 [Leptodophora sp. 'Broadleaf-Isolate-01']